MERTIDLKEISDGRRYGSNDMVRADCGGCQGCSACCRGMGASIQLDPLDLFWLTQGMKTNFQQLLSGAVELGVVDGLILPHLKMTEGEDQCPFLSQEGRCKIHRFRPGFCRLFPLGRLYENRGFSYFLQIHECRKQGRTKVKVSRWLDVADLKAYEAFITDWHYFQKDLEMAMKTRGIWGKPESRSICLAVLNCFYGRPYETDRAFYPQFYKRLEEGRALTRACEDPRLQR